MTSMTQAVNEIVFPAGFSEVFAVRSKLDIRIWNVTDYKELLRISLMDNIGP